MKTYNTVKTYETAVDLLSTYCFDNSIHGFKIEDTIARCECGMTNAVKSYIQTDNGDEIVVVAYCDCCGDDDAFVSEVLNID